jgi:hypothetical protein
VCYNVLSNYISYFILVIQFYYLRVGHFDNMMQVRSGGWFLAWLLVHSGDCDLPASYLQVTFEHNIP